MIRNHASIAEWRVEWYKNYLDLDYIEDERKYPMNISAISGRLTKDPELRHTKSDVPVVSFRVAVRRPGSKENTDFINCVAWRDTAEFICKWFKKGQAIEASGYLKNDTYKKNDVEYQTQVLNCERIGFGSPKQSDEKSESESEDTSESFHELSDEDVGDELPF